MRHHLLFVLLAVSCLCRSLSTADAASYTFTTLTVPGSITTVAGGINTAGQIVGRFRDAAGIGHGFLTADGTTFTIIDVPSAAETTEANGINDAGQIVGIFRDATRGLHSFLKDGTTLTTFDVPGATDTYANGINDSGQIVGFFNDATGGTHGFLTANGTTFTTIDVPGAQSTQAFGINDSGDIVGLFRDATGNHGFVTDGTTFTTIDVPSASLTQARGINTTGQIMGTFSDTTGGLHGFVTDGATFMTIDAPGAQFTEAFGINDVGQIVGFFGDGRGGANGFVATPIQELVAWIGLKNSDDQGTAFDLQAEVSINSRPVATATTRCITGVARNPDKATEAMILFGSFPPVSVAPDAVPSLTIRARIGTHPDGTKCPGHSNAVGLRLYYDAISRPSRISTQLTPDPVRDFFLHSSSSDFLDNSAPTATTAKFKDSAGLNFAGGNPWKAIGTWSMTLP